MSSSRPNTQQAPGAPPGAFPHLDAEQAEAIAARFRPIWDESAPSTPSPPVEAGFASPSGNVPFPPPPRPSPPLPAFLSPEALKASYNVPASTPMPPQAAPPPMAMGFGAPPSSVEAHSGMRQGPPPGLPPGRLMHSHTVKLPIPPPGFVDQISARDPSPEELRIVRPPRRRLVWVVAAGLAGALGLGLISIALSGPSSSSSSDPSSTSATSEGSSDDSAAKAAADKAAAVEKAAAEKVAAAEKAAAEKVAAFEKAAAEKAAAAQKTAAEKPAAVAETAPDAHEPKGGASVRHEDPKPPPRAVVARPVARPAPPPPPPARPVAHDPPAPKPAAAKPGNGAIVRDAPF